MQKPPWPFKNFSRNKKAPAQRKETPRVTLRMPKPGSPDETQQLRALVRLQELQKRGLRERDK